MSGGRGRDMLFILKRIMEFLLIAYAEWYKGNLLNTVKMLGAAIKDLERLKFAIENEDVTALEIAARAEDFEISEFEDSLAAPAGKDGSDDN